MNPSEQFCPNESCLARGKVGEGNIRIHDRTRQHCGCRVCKATFRARRGTMLQELRSPTEVIVMVVTLLAYGYPVQAFVHAFAVDEQTVARTCRRTVSASASRPGQTREAQLTACASQ